MKKRWIALGVVALIGAGGYWGFQENKYRLPGMIQDWRDPVQPNHAVVWQQGPGAAPVTAPGTKRPPNIILIVADDLGWNDISLNGGGVAGGIVKTPNIDALARQGLNFTTAYAANATCSPSRAAMMTGRYPTRFGFEFTAVPTAFAENLAHGGGLGPLKAVFHKELITDDIPDYPDMGVPPSEITIAEAVKAAGYHTIHIGKWHLGEAPRLQPNAQGFDESLAILAGGAKFLPDDDPDTVNAKLPWDPIDRFIWANLRHAVTFNGGKRFHPQGHMTDYFAAEAEKAIDANKNRPFFMYLAFNAPHTPLQATREDYDRLPQIKDHKTRVYGAMIAQLDRRIGDVMAKLKQAGIDDNTLVIFTSDNGGVWDDGYEDHGPADVHALNGALRGTKGTLFEGGHRVPFIARWPGKIKAGSENKALIAHVDMPATLASLTGINLPADAAPDSFNVLPALLGESETAREHAIFHVGGTKTPLTLRHGNWKFMEAGKGGYGKAAAKKDSGGNQVQLYDLSQDPSEQNNLAEKLPEKAKEFGDFLRQAREAGRTRP